MASNSGGFGRRVLLRRGAGACAGVAASMLFPQLALAGAPVSSGKVPTGQVKASVFRWLDSARVPNLRDLRPGWTAACAATAALTCPVRLTDLVDAAPVRNWSGPQQLNVRLIGYDGISPAANHGLDVLYPADGQTTLMPYRLAEVRNNRLQGASQSQLAWAWDGRIPLSISSGQAAKSMSQPVDVPAEHGVYLIALADGGRWIDPAALAFAPSAGAFHRRLLDLYGQPMRELGYFAISVSKGST